MSYYTTIQGDTWDLISYRVYGSNHHTKELIFLNSQHREISIFQAGVVLKIPEISVQAATSIPPWLRSTEPEAVIPDASILIDFERSTVFSYRFAERWNNRVTEATRFKGDI